MAIFNSYVKLPEGIGIVYDIELLFCYWDIGILNYWDDEFNEWDRYDQ